MRLNQYEINSIKKCFQTTFQTGMIYLFGSRVDDTKKGGDIDLYIVTQDSDKVRKKINFLTQLKNLIGEQKIDVVLSYDKTTPIEKEAIKYGVKLWT